jgi:hypothetical protein
MRFVRTMLCEDCGRTAAKGESILRWAGVFTRATTEWRGGRIESATHMGDLCPGCNDLRSTANQKGSAT